MQKGVISGNFYKNGVDCLPFNLPQPLRKMKSHALDDEDDWIFFYEINDEIKKIVDGYELDLI